MRTLLSITLLFSLFLLGCGGAAKDAPVETEDSPAMTEDEAAEEDAAEDAEEE